MKRANRPPAYIPKPRTVTLKPTDYQPSKAELEEEIDMPSMSDDEIRRVFFQPVNFSRKSK